MLSLLSKFYFCVDQTKLTFIHKASKDVKSRSNSKMYEQFIDN